MNAKLAYLFPGQGSQSVGMGAELYREFAAVRQVFEAAEDLTGLPIARLCFEGPMEELTQTVHLQPALTAVNLSFLTVLEHRGILAHVAAGHSLGEFAALRAAGVLGTAETLRAVHRRGILMHRESLRRPGAMTALIGLPIGEVEAITAEVQPPGAVSVANHNAETQVVITGTPDAVETAARAAADRGARAVPLKVSGAWHSELIRGAESEFAEFLQQIPFAAPRFPVLHNVSAESCPDPAHIRSLMARQLCSPVRWHDTMLRLIDSGVEVIAEVGPGKVLTGLAKKALPRDSKVRLYSLNTIAALDAFSGKEGG